MKKGIALILSFVLLMSCIGSASAAGLWGSLRTATSSGSTSWAIYWYLCGSDLETDGGCASDDLRELRRVTLPENVTVVIQTGGAQEWQDDAISSEKIGRYVYEGDTLYRLDELPQASMGDGETLTSFLSFCKENYPADKEMVIFWNHGGGSCAGICYDENYDMDHLTIPELHSAMAEVFTPNSENPELEFVGFDTCLMGSLETAAAMEGISHYMIASEETEPGCGWNYQLMMKELSKDTDMDSEDFGRIVVDSYMKGCEDVDQAESTTLSVINLCKLPALLEAYEAFGEEALAQADASFFASFGRGARKSENYGGNTKQSGFHDMVDLGDLVINNAASFPESAQAMMDALSECVVYSVSGEYRARALGLSSYYPYSGDVDLLAEYMESACGESMPSFYRQMLLGNREEAQSVTGGGSWFSHFFGEEDESTSGDGVVQPEQSTSAESSGGGWLAHATSNYGHSAPVVELPESLEVEMDDDLVAHLSVPTDVMELVSGLYIQMYLFDMDRDTMAYLGRDTNLSGYWDEGEFSAEFRGTWGAIDGHICYMEPVFESVDYNTYSVPVLLNGEQFHLEVVYNYDQAAYKITGAREGLEDGMGAGKRLIQLKPGDVLTTILYTSGLEDDSDYVYGEEYETFTVTEDTCFEDDFLPDGWYYMPFELVDYRNNSVYSDSPVYELSDGYITLVED